MTPIYDKTLQEVLKIRDELNRQLENKSPKEQSVFVRELLKQKPLSSPCLLQK